jgi:hypothetical protein
MDNHLLEQTVSFITEYYNGCKVGYVGHEGYRKSTDLLKFVKCIDELILLGYIKPDSTVFLDLGCADGRVNVLTSYFVKRSIGIEIDRDILAEFGYRQEDLFAKLQKANLILPSDSIAVFHGNSLEDATYERIFKSTGIRFTDIDLFYTYITLHDLFGAKIAEQAKRGALYLVYGFSKILPHYWGLEILLPDVASQGIMALYGKV